MIILNSQRGRQFWSVTLRSKAEENKAHRKAFSYSVFQQFHISTMVTILEMVPKSLQRSGNLSQHVKNSEEGNYKHKSALTHYQDILDLDFVDLLSLP